MSRSRLFATVRMAVLVVTAASPVSAQGVEGAWKMIELAVEAPDTSFVNSEPVALYYLFADGHYAVVGHIGERASLPESDATDEQLVQAWGPWIGNVGSYEADGEMLVLTTIVAKNPNADTAPRERNFSIEGDVLTMWWTNPNGSEIKTTWRRGD